MTEPELVLTAGSQVGGWWSGGTQGCWRIGGAGWQGHSEGIAGPARLGIKPGTCIFCPVCSRVLCAECNPVHEANLCPLHKCAKCLAGQASGSRGGSRVREIRRLLDLVAEGTRSGSWKVQRRGLAHFAQYLEGRRGRLPAQEMDVTLWVADCVKRRDRLDSSTAESYMAGVAAYHLQAGVATEGQVKNSTRGQMVRSVLKVVRKNYKLESKAQRPLSLAEWLGVWSRGFDLVEDIR